MYLRRSWGESPAHPSLRMDLSGCFWSKGALQKKAEEQSKGNSNLPQLHPPFQHTRRICNPVVPKLVALW